MASTAQAAATRVADGDGILRALLGGGRDVLEAFIERAIDALDALDGEADLEPEFDVEHDGREPEDGA